MFHSLSSPQVMPILQTSLTAKSSTDSSWIKVPINLQKIEGKVTKTNESFDSNLNYILSFQKQWWMDQHQDIWRVCWRQSSMYWIQSKSYQDKIQVDRKRTSRYWRHSVTVIGQVLRMIEEASMDIVFHWTYA